MNLAGVRSGFAVGYVKIFFVLSVLFSSLYFSQVLAGGGAPPPPPVVTPTISPNGASSENSVSVSITGNYQIRYTTNGSIPTISSPIYSAPLTINSSVTLKARGVRVYTLSTPGGPYTRYSWGSTATAAFTLSAGQPIVSTPGGNFSGPVNVVLSSPTAGANIHCTINGTTPTSSSPTCTSVNINQSTVVKAIAVKSGFNTSSEIEETYNITSQLSEPTITPNGGTHSGSVQVQLYSSDSGASIHYTLDGSTPSVNSPVYSNSIALSSTSTVKAISVKSGYPSSSVMSRSFTVNASTQACAADYGSSAIRRILASTESDPTVGAISGQHSVTSTGASSYSIPIGVLPGTAGVEPKLTLEYMSGGGNGIFGLGFQLNGLSSIQRCGTTIEQGGIFGGVDLDNQDEFCVDGARMLAVNGGTYGADGTEYRTETNSFNKIVSIGISGSGPEKFQVWTKSGEVLEYGFNEDAKIKFTDDVAVWTLNKLSDTAGNSLNISYYTDASVNEQKPWRIEYTENTSVGLSANQYLEFVYESRNDSVGHMLADKFLQVDERVSQINIGEGITNKKVYKFTYIDRNTDSSLLNDVEECYLNDSQTEQCLPKTTFTWHESQGDVALSTAEPFVVSDGYYFDVTGDGLDDLITIQAGGNVHGASRNIYVSNSNGNGFDPQTVAGTYVPICRQVLIVPIASLYETQCNTLAPLFADVTGDGKSDLIYSKSNYIYVMPSNGNTFSAVQNWGALGSAGYPNPEPILKQNMLGDMNGDGKDDILYINNLTKPNSLTYPRQLRARFSTGTAFGGSSLMSNLLSYCPIRVIPNSNPFSSGTLACELLVGGLEDVNGDGRADFVMLNEIRTATNITSVRISKGSSFLPPINNNSIVSKTSPTVDVDGDGRKDIISYSSAGTGLSRTYKVNVNYAAGLGYSTKEEIYSYPVTCRYSYRNIGPGGTQVITVCPNQSISFADINGDGASDLLNAATDQLYLTQVPESDVITKVTSGSGSGLENEVEFIYSTLEDPNVYTPGTGAVYPNVDLSDRFHSGVVSQVKSENGIGGMLSTSYQYEHCRGNLHGHGNLGFAKVIETDDATGIQSILFNRQDYPYIGDVERTESRLANGQLLSETDVTHSLQGTVGSGPIFPYVSEQVEKTYDVLNGNLITTVTTNTTLDDYGNAENVTVTTTDNTGSYTTSTVNNYINNETKWHLGRLMDSTVTKTGGYEDAPARTSSFTYDSQTGFLITETVESGANALTKTYTHDDYGNRISVTTSGLGITSRTTSTSYDSDGRFPISATNAKSHSETREYNNAWGGVTKLTGPNNLDTVWQYDAQGRKVREIRADGTSTDIYYNWCTSGCANAGANAKYKVTTISTASATSVAYFDQLGREILRESESFNGSSVFVATVFDSMGRTDKVYQPYSGSQGAYTQYHYDILDRVTQEDSPVTGVTTSDYNGLSVTITVENGSAADQTTVETKNSLGWTLTTTDNVGNDTTFDYDSQGNLRFVTDSEGNQTENQYDVRGFKIYMDDPDMGEWDYEYNVLGELTSQTDAKGQIVTMQYDVLGRLTQRTEPEGNANWVYDSASHGIGKLANESQAGGLSRTYSYDSLGRPTDTTTVIGGTSYVASVSYDSVGRVDINTYPETLFQTQNIYNEVGFLEKVREANGNCTNYWTAIAANDYGNITLESLGNNVMTARSYSASTGRITTINSNVGQIQNLTYDWDAIGNLKQRKEVQGGTTITENFLYDGLNRLTSAEYVGVGTKTFTYDSIGNIKTKSDVEAGATYNYGAGNAGPHAVTSVGGTTYTYDANGNMLNGDGRSITWSSYNKPVSIAKNGSTSQFKYGPDRSRYEQNLQVGSNTTTTTYLGAMEKVEKSNDSVTEYKHFISAGGNTIAIYTKRSSNVNDTRYLHRDHLGSIDAITDENANIVERLSYDAFGKRRLSNWNDGIPTIQSNNTRGFTGHEMLDAVGIIHMNGRVYDPTLGRFLSADPNVQAPKNMQSLNRYSYVLNNPLSYTDPSGFFFKSLFKKIKRAIKRLIRSIVHAIRDFIKKYARTIVAIAFVVAAPYIGLTNPYLVGFGSGLIASGGDIKQGIISAVAFGFQIAPPIPGAEGSALGQLNYGNAAQAAATGGGNGFDWKGLANKAFHLSGATKTNSSRGSRSSGGSSGSASPVESPSTINATNSSSRGAGGVVSDVSGGKFAGGESTGSYVYLLGIKDVQICNEGCSVVQSSVAGSGGIFGVGVEGGQLLVIDRALGVAVHLGYLGFGPSLSALPASLALTYEGGAIITPTTLDSLTGVGLSVNFTAAALKKGVTGQVFGSGNFADGTFGFTGGGAIGAAAGVTGIGYYTIHIDTYDLNSIPSNVSEKFGL